MYTTLMSPTSADSGGIEDNIDVFVEPVSEEGVGNADIKSRAIPANELRRLEPGVVALRVYFFFNFIENLLPGIHETATMMKGQDFHKDFHVCGNPKMPEAAWETRQSSTFIFPFQPAKVSCRERQN